MHFSFDLYSFLLSVTITLGLYVLYTLLFNRKDALDLYYKKTARNHVLLKYLKKEYYLPFWCKSTFLQIVYSLGEWRRKKIDLSFTPYNEIDFVPCGISDNETLLHWRIHRDNQGQIITKPVVIIFPGLTGNSSDSYLRTLIITLGDSYHICVANRIGSGESILRDHRLTFMSNWKSLDHIVNFVFQKMNGDVPVQEAKMPLFAVGYSLGGHNLLKYLTKKEFSPFKLMAAVTLSQVFDIASNTYHVEKAHPYYTRILTNSLKRFVSKNEAVFKAYETSDEGIRNNFSLKKVYSARTIPEFDNALVRVIHNMESVEKDYYPINAISEEDLKNVNIPVFILHSLDDPVCTMNGIPKNAPDQNENIIIGLTKYGTHCGFLQGGVFVPDVTSYSDEICRDYFSAILDLYQHYRYETDELL